jgi:NADH-quinone oxidoreductase subunit A
MESVLLPILLLAVCATVVAVGMIAASAVLGPRRNSAAKQMPYESGMDPVHDARRRFDVRFHLVAIAFLVFDVELLFLYPWAVASRDSIHGIPDDARLLVFGEVMVFIALLAVGLVYAWRRGVFRWR